jgi:hypothetical protein
MWEKYGTARQATDGNIIWSMRFACWITKARIQTPFHNICYNTYCVSTTTEVTLTRLSVMFIRTLPIFLICTLDRGDCSVSRPRRFNPGG